MNDSPNRRPIAVRTVTAIVIVPLALYAVEMIAASQGRGGAFALVIASIVMASIALLAWSMVTPPLRARFSVVLTRIHLIVAALAAFGYTGLQLAQHAFPDSNLMGGFALLFGPLLWLGVLGLAILLLPVTFARAFGVSR